MTESRNRFSSQRSVWIIIVIGACVAIAMTVVGFALADAEDRGFWWEIGTTGLQLGVVTLFGAVLAVVTEDDRRKRQVTEERQLAYRRFLDAYNKVKLARRTLRALGMKSPAFPIDVDRMRLIRAEFLRLNEAQTEFETQKETFGDLFANPSITTHICEMEKYLNEGVSCAGLKHETGGILSEWEGSAAHLQGDVSPTTVNNLTALQAFLDAPETSFGRLKESQKAAEQAMRLEIRER